MFQRYRSIDTAQVYRNEQDVGAFLKDLFANGTLKREDVFVTTKIAPTNQGDEKAHKSVAESLKKLDLEYIDLVLIHWPGSSGIQPGDERNKDRRKATWQALEKLATEEIGDANGGIRTRVRYIGVSNYNERHLEELLTYAKIKPFLNQVEFHPLHPNPSLYNFCKTNDIPLQAYSSLGEGNLVDPKYLNDTRNNEDISLSTTFERILSNPIHKAAGMNVAHMLLRWAIQKGVRVIPKSSNEQRIAGNLKAGLEDAFHLTAEEMDILDNLTTAHGYIPSFVVVPPAVVEAAVDFVEIEVADEAVAQTLAVQKPVPACDHAWERVSLDVGIAVGRVAGKAVGVATSGTCDESGKGIVPGCVGAGIGREATAADVVGYQNAAVEAEIVGVVEVAEFVEEGSRLPDVKEGASQP
ncbi:hypothetical protein HDU97_000467 [Phlyctochytrium planicorne]|nr:hypothetical protein HDU97_000467 [Phlyctochytrium planicorne]